MRILEGKERQKILGQQKKWLDRYVEYIAEEGLTDSQQQEKRAAANSDQVIILQCQRSLPNGRKVALIWGKGISTPKGIATAQDQAISYVVRNSFTAKFSCDRINAQSSCIPVLPMRLNFTAQIPRSQATKILLKSADGKSIRPSSLSKDKSDFVNWPVSTPFPEKSVFTLELPEKLRDDAGRLLVNASNYPLKVATDELPPLAKFPARFGILELNAEPVLPVTLRNLEAMVRARSAQPGKPVEEQDTRKSLPDRAVKKLLSFFGTDKRDSIEGRMQSVIQEDSDVIDMMKRLNRADNWKMVEVSR
ncbi:MAG: hypothetical protein IPP36_11340 [Nitrosomonadales bacterium]|nr:hypothetical protein [Nitrosomonadales bacterium]